MPTNLTCYDCSYFKAESEFSACPKHATPEERAVFEAKVKATLASPGFEEYVQAMRRMADGK